MSARNRAIHRAHRDGVSGVQLAQEWGISRQRVDQIIEAQARREDELVDVRGKLEARARSDRLDLGRLFAERRALNARIRGVLTDLRATQDELSAMAVDRLLGV